MSGREFQGRIRFWPRVLMLNVSRQRGWAGYSIAMAIVAICGGLTWAMKQVLGVENGFLVFLLGVAVVAVRYGTGPSVAASIGGTALLTFFFMPPIFSFAVADIQHVFTLAVMVTLAIVISTLGSQVLLQGEAAKLSAERFEALYRLSRDLADVAGSEQLARAAVKHIQSVFSGEAAILLPDDGRGFLKNVRGVLGSETIMTSAEYGYGFRPVPGSPLAASFRQVEWSAARAARESKKVCGTGTYMVSNANTVFVPLCSSNAQVGVLAVRPPAPQHAFDEDQMQMLATLAGQLTGALERDRLSTHLQTVQDEAETERMRSALLSSVSHDLRTPLAAIAGASSSMLDDGDTSLPPAARRELCQSIFDSADRLSRIVDNLLNMTRIESGTFRVAKQQHVVEEIVGSTLHRMTDQLKGRKVQTRLPSELPSVPLDDVLFQQVLINLVDNAVRYVPATAEIEISASAENGWLSVEVADRGPGLRPGDEERVFEKFYRGPLPRPQSGTGLGLTICRAIISAHGGTISADNRTGGGAVFRIRVPLHIAAANDETTRSMRAASAAGGAT